MTVKEDESEMYELICNKRFDTLEGMQKQVLDILKGKNGDAGLCEQVRDNTKARKQFGKALIFIVAAVSLKIIHSAYCWVAGIIASRGPNLP